MTAPVLTRRTVGGVTLLGDEHRPGGVTLAFTERTGGVSQPPYASLNLGSRCGDDPAA
ncbi:MAG: laccase domain-containing protein, partial [Atopobiaceae bacterium]|nr:laccase domain-containing protein [Atopobiaceae bacterium]